MRLFVSFVLMTLTLSLSVSPWSWANEWVVDSNTIALYHFDSLTDATQNGFDLTRNGNAILTDENLEWMDDPHGKALKISALGDQATVLIPDEMVLPGRSATSLTFDAWFYPIAYKAYGISNHQILSLYQSWDCGLEVRDGKWNSPPVPAMRAAAAIVVTDDQWQQGVSLNAWHFLRITYENDYVSVFLDGQLLEAGTTSFNMDRTSDWILTLGNFEGYLDEVRISNIVRTDSPPTVNLENQPPVIDAGLDQEIRIDHIADLRGQANDDGLIDVPLYTEWSTITGPGTVIFGNENSTETSVDFSEIGSYVLRLSADDGEFIAFDEVVITVVDMPEPSTLPFSIIVLPDTQAYSDYSPEKFTSQTQWIADHAEELNITFVLHEGDIVNHADEPLEWDNAAYSLSILNGITPYLLSVGNHDYDGERNSSAFNTTFPVSRYETMDSFGGVFEAGKLDNSYHLFSAGGVNFLTLSLEFGPRDDVLNWADSVISAYPNRRIILVTHAYLSGDGTRLDQGDDYNPHFYTLSDSINDGEEVWQALVKKHPNIDFVFSGHVRGIDGTGCAHAYRTDLGDYGNIVHQMVANYQDCYSGGDGYLRIITFDPVARKASVETYSPYLDSYLTDSNNEFVIQNLDFFGQGAVQNRPPVGKDQEIGVQENSSVEILLAATDADGDNLIYQIAVFPDHGTLSGTPPSVTYAPSEDYSGPDSFTFEVSDGKGGSDTAEISITVSPIHIGEEGDEFEGDENTIALYHFDNLTDTGQNGFDLTIEGEAQLTDENIGWMENPHGKALKVMDLGDQVTVSIPDTIVMPDSSLSPLTMEARFYPVSYKAYGVNNYQILTLYQSWDAGIEVRDGKWNSPRVPTVRAGKTTVATENQWEEGVSLNEWHALRITMDANLVEVYMDDQLMGSTANTLNAGRVTDWTLTLGNFEGYIDEVRLSNVIREGSSITYPPENQPPTVDTGSDKNTILGETVSLTGIVDDDGMLDLIPTVQWSKISGPGEAVFSNSSAAVTDASFSSAGQYILELRAFDGGLYGSDTVSISVIASNTPPVGEDQEITVQEDGSVEILLAAADVDGDNLTYQIVVFPDHGTLSGTPPLITYAPSEEYYGPDSFIFKVSDGKSGTDTAEISITVLPIHIGEEGDEFEGDENTIALYHFDDLIDTGQNGFDLTIEGEAQLTDENIGWMENPHGKALKVMDLGDQVTVSIPDTIVMPDSSLSPLTMEARFYPVSYKAYGVNNYQILTLYQSWDAGIEVRDGKWNSPRVPTVRAGKTTVATENQWEEGVSLNEWHALRITMDANLVEVYMDDQLMGSTANTLNAGRVTDWTLTLGNFEGYIDEVRISSIGR